MFDKNFYKDVEIPGRLKHILYSDTDSVFITVPRKNSQELSLKDRWDLIEKVAEDINDVVIRYNTEYLLPMMNIDPKYNKTFFKTEFLMETMMFLDVKKNYAYLLSVKEGKILSPPKPGYKGIPIVKSDAALITRNLLTDIINNIVLDINMDITEKYNLTIECITKYKNIFNTNIKDLDLLEIGMPKKWNKQDYVLNGMKLWNEISNSEDFTPGTSGLLFYITKGSGEKIKTIDLKDTSSMTLVVPYNYNKKTLLENLAKYQINIDKNKQWDTVYHKIIERVLDCLKYMSMENNK